MSSNVRGFRNQCSGFQELPSRRLKGVQGPLGLWKTPLPSHSNVRGFRNQCSGFQEPMLGVSGTGLPTNSFTYKGLLVPYALVTHYFNSINTHGHLPSVRFAHCAPRLTAWPNKKEGERHKRSPPFSHTAATRPWLSGIATRFSDRAREVGRARQRPAPQQTPAAAPVRPGRRPV